MTLLALGSHFSGIGEGWGDGGEEVSGLSPTMTSQAASPFDTHSHFSVAVRAQLKATVNRQSLQFPVVAIYTDK